MILGGKNCAVCHGKMHTVCGRQLGGDNWICNQCDLAEPTTNTVPVPIAGYALVVRKAGGQTVVLKPTLAVLRSANAEGGVKGALVSSDDEPANPSEDEIIDRIPLDHNGRIIDQGQEQNGGSMPPAPTAPGAEGIRDPVGLVKAWAIPPVEVAPQ